MYDNAMIYWAIAVGTMTALLTRGLPYLLFGGKKALPPIVKYLGNVLPPAIMIILVVYCLRGIDFQAFPFGLAEIASAVVIIVMQVWRKNTFLSIGVGTALYMILIRTL